MFCLQQAFLDVLFHKKEEPTKKLDAKSAIINSSVILRPFLVLVTSYLKSAQTPHWLKAVVTSQRQEHQIQIIAVPQGVIHQGTGRQVKPQEQITEISLG